MQLNSAEADVKKCFAELQYEPRNPEARELLRLAKREFDRAKLRLREVTGGR